jgi:hypothetical protein
MAGDVNCIEIGAYCNVQVALALMGSIRKGNTLLMNPT